MLRHIFFCDMREEFCGKKSQKKYNCRLKTGDKVNHGDRRQKQGEIGQKIAGNCH